MITPVAGFQKYEERISSLKVFGLGSVSHVSFIQSIYYLVIYNQLDNTPQVSERLLSAKHLLCFSNLLKKKVFSFNTYEAVDLFTVFEQDKCRNVTYREFG